MAGRRIVEMVHEDLRMSKILTKEAFENAIMVNGAIGGSTNAVVHLLAIAGRIGVALTLDDWDRLGRAMPCLVNLMPSGQYLMEDFYYAGGLPVVIREIGASPSQERADGQRQRDLGQRQGRRQLQRESDHAGRQAVQAARRHRRAAGQPRPERRGAEAVRGDTEALEAQGTRRRVRRTSTICNARIDDPKLDVESDDVLVLKNCGPKGYPGFPEVGNFALPAKLLKQGVTDMIRISDARMSGTAYGTVVLHTAPEAAAGGPLALVENGDLIELDVAKRRLHLHVSEKELARRKARWKPPKPHADRGWVKLYCETVQQADRGVDLEFLVGKSGAKVGRESH